MWLKEVLLALISPDSEIKSGTDAAIFSSTKTFTYCKTFEKENAKEKKNTVVLADDQIETLKLLKDFFRRRYYYERKNKFWDCSYKIAPLRSSDLFSVEGGLSQNIVYFF